jgi:hypothetical protein
MQSNAAQSNHGTDYQNEWRVEMKKTTIVAILCAGTMLVTSGCAFIHGFDETKTEHKFERLQPLLITSEEAKKVRTVVVAPPTDKHIDPAETTYLAERLGKSGRFRVIGPSSFARKASEERIDLSLVIDSDRASLAQKIGNELQADAVLFVTGVGDTKANMNLFDAILGKGDIETGNHLRAYSTNSGKVIWEQVQRLKLNVGAFNTPSKEKIIIDQHDPLIQNFLASF